MQRIYDGRILFRTFSDVLLAFAYASAIETFVLKLMFEFHNFFVFLKPMIFSKMSTELFGFLFPGNFSLIRAFLTSINHH